jgi:hypothetical protein
MRKITISAVAVSAVLALTGCASNSDLGLGPVNTNGPPSDFLSPADSPGPSQPQQRHHHRHHHHRAQVAAAGLVRVHDPGQVTGTVSGPCHARDGGRLPDRRCTPGAYDPAVTRAVLCSGGYSTDSYRPPSSQTDSFKFSEAYPAYSITAETSSELDHLVPLELGGANDAANLWPEVGPLPNPKDYVENALHDAVCSGWVTLAAAQRAIARNWEIALQQLGISGGTAPQLQPTGGGGGSCHPTTPSGNCYKRGEFCSEPEHGETGVAGNGETITCKQVGSYWRWE